MCVCVCVLSLRTLTPCNIMSCPRTRTNTIYMYREDGEEEEGGMSLFFTSFQLPASTGNYFDSKSKVSSSHPYCYFLITSFSIFLFHPMLVAAWEMKSRQRVRIWCRMNPQYVSRHAVCCSCPTVSDSAGNCFDSASNILEYSPYVLHIIFSCFSCSGTAGNYCFLT